MYEISYTAKLASCSSKTSSQFECTGPRKIRAVFRIHVIMFLLMHVVICAWSTVVRLHSAHPCRRSCRHITGSCAVILDYFLHFTTATNWCLCLFLWYWNHLATSNTTLRQTSRMHICALCFLPTSGNLVIPISRCGVLKKLRVARMVKKLWDFSGIHGLLLC
jgi:hypothetical protein